MPAVRPIDPDAQRAVVQGSESRDVRCHPCRVLLERLGRIASRLSGVLRRSPGNRPAYGKALTHYESGPDGVTAHFADGSSAHGDVLVGADGIRSAVRSQRVPGHEAVDAGITAIYGRLPMKAAETLVPGPVLTDIFAIATDARKVFLGLGSVCFPRPPEPAAAELAPEMAMAAREDYLVCIVGGRHEYFPQLGETGPELRARAADALRDWAGPVAELFDVADPESFFPVRMSTSVPHTLDKPTNVTLLGDAVHAMTPTLGRGANVAMRDGALLGRALHAVATGRIELVAALAAYEGDMLTYGFGVVRSAARIGEQRMAQNRFPGEGAMGQGHGPRPR